MGKWILAPLSDEAKAFVSNKSFSKEKLTKTIHYSLLALHFMQRVTAYQNPSLLSKVRRI